MNISHDAAAIDKNGGWKREYRIELWQFAGGIGFVRVAGQ
jgi:hypothetical protein